MATTGRQAGSELHNTPRGGNKLLRETFKRLHEAPSNRANIPPFLLFERSPTTRATRSYRFRGLAAPGYPGLTGTNDLVAVWKSSGGQRFQNYRAVFSILNVPKISREWLCDINEGNALASQYCPNQWRAWVEHGEYELLKAPPVTAVRDLNAQLPQTDLERSVLRTVFEMFREIPIEFENFASRIYQSTAPDHIIIDEVTRGTRDGGRDAVGRYRLGLKADPIYADFSLEAKLYNPGLEAGASPNKVGVKETARLISRIRNRQFGVLVTTSALAAQAYKEVRNDGHPIIVISGGDIAKILIKMGYVDEDQIRRFALQ